VAPDDETGIAWDSLVEGTASRIETRFISALPDADKKSVQAEQQRIAGQLPKDLPDYVLVEYAFPFGSGPKFADYLLTNRGPARVIDPGQAETAADGWGTDRYVTWKNGSQTCVRLSVDMDTPDKLAAMGQALADWAKGTPGATVQGSGPFTVTRCV